MNWQVIEKAGAAPVNFEWDSSKAERNRKKHDVSFEEAAFVFSDPLNITIFDDMHSEKENRWITIGMVFGKCLVVVHSYPLEPVDEPIRIISARLADPRERRQYEEG
jgi:hypothetical protein